MAAVSLKEPFLRGISGAQPTGDEPGEGSSRSTSSDEQKLAQGAVRKKTLSLAMQREREAVAKLADLTQILQENGLYEKFLEHRDGNRRWRSGKASGAKGEATAAALNKSQADFVKLNPTVTTFTFRRTLAFWIPTLSFEGCLLFIWSMWFGQYGQLRSIRKLNYALTRGPNLAGGTCFFMSIYMSYFELINLDTNIDSDRLRYFSFNYGNLVERGVGISSVVSALCYVFGAILYTVEQVADFWEHDPEWQAYLIEWPLIVGGFLFFVGGMCEMVINEVWRKWPDELVWWVSVLDACGGATFWLSACPSVFAGESATIVGLAGCGVYILASILSLIMWQGEQFGGATIPVLNRALREGGTLQVVKDPQTGIPLIQPGKAVTDVEDAEQMAETSLSNYLNPKLTTRALLFLVIYLLIGAVQVLSCCTSLIEINDNLSRSHRWVMDWNMQNSLSIFLSSLMNWFIVVMVMVLTSACVQMPKEEPYHTLVIMLRIMGLVLLCDSVLTLDVHFGLFGSYDLAHYLELWSSSQMTETELLARPHVI